MQRSHTIVTAAAGTASVLLALCGQANAANDQAHARVPGHAVPNPAAEKVLPPAPTVKTDAVTTKPAGPVAPMMNKTGREAPRASHRSIPHDQMYYDTSADGTVWARGQSYKASFGTDGATYIPFLGACAPQNYPVHATIDGITVGGQPVGFDGFAAATRDGSRVSFDRGSLVEVYDLSLTSVEQSFVFSSLPASGDLVVHVNIQSELARSERAEGFEFANERGSVHYGRAQVFDAAGRATSSTTRLSDGGIEIRVPASEIALATFPLTVDPVISTFVIDGTSPDDYVPDVAYDATNNVYCVSEEETFSSTDHDCYASEVDASGNVITAGYVDISTNYWQTPKVANNQAADQFLVVAAVGLPSSGTRIIQGREIAASGFGMGAQFTISLTDQTGDKLNPDVGGDPFGSGPTYYCVVWTRIFTSSDFDVHGVLVTTGSSDLSTSTILIDNSVSADTVPHISKGDGQPGDWLVVWNRDFTSSDRDVRGAQIDFGGNITIASSSIDFSSSDDTNPRVSSPLEDDGSFPLHYMVVYERDFGGGDHDVQGTLVSGVTVLDSQDLSFTFENAFNTENQVHPSVDTDGRHFTVAYSEQFNFSATDYDIYASDYAESGNSIVADEVHQNLAFTSDTESNPLVASNRSAGGSGSRGMIVWDDLVAAGNRNVSGGFYDKVSGGPISGFCAGDGSGTACPCGNTGAPGNGCGNSANSSGAHLSTTGNASTAADTLVLHGTGQPAATSGLYFQGTSSLGGGSVFGDGLRCAGGSVIRLGTKSTVGGVSQYPSGADPSVSVRGLVPATGGTFFYQLWYRNAAAFCTSSTFNLTNGVSVVWTP